MCFFLGVFGLLLSGCAGANGSVAAVPARDEPARHHEPGRLYDSRHGFSIIPPPGYVNSGPSGDHFMVCLGPQEGEFTVNFNVTDHAADMPPQQAGPLVKAVLPHVLKGYLPVDEGLASIDGRQCYWVSGTFVWEGRSLRNLQYFLTGGNGRLYVITFAAPVLAFDRHRQSFESSATTARLD